MDIFWSTVYPMDVYSDYNMLYKEPSPLLPEILKDRGPENPHDYFACPAFHLHSANMFVIRSTLDTHVGIQKEGFTALDEHSKLTGKLFSFLHPTRKGFRSILFDHRMLFFSETPVTLSTYPAYMHRTEIQSKLTYVPGAYDISKWLRPLQGTYEVPETIQSIQIHEDDPLYYVKFDTPEKVRLKRFQVVPELLAITHGCVHYKLFRPQSSLNRVYAAFTQSKQHKRTLKLIKENLLD